MKYFTNPRSRRSTAFVVLLVWLFAVASGIANACVLKTRGDHAQVVTSDALEAALAQNAPAGHKPGATDHDGYELEISKAPCLKVCDDGTQLLFKQQGSLDFGDLGSSFFVSVLWTAVIPFATTPLQRDGLQATAHGPPFRVSYSRLTL